MYPYGARYSTSGRSEVSRSKYPCLLRLDSTGEISSDNSHDSVKETNSKDNTTHRNMGLSTLMHSNNFLTRNSLCSPQKGLCSSKKSFSTIRENIYSMNENLNESPIMMESTCNSNSGTPAPACSWGSWNSYRDSKPYKVQMKPQNLVFHPYVKQNMSSSQVSSTVPNVEMLSSITKNSLKPVRQSVPGNCFKTLPKCKKKNRYNRYQWQPKKDEKTIQTSLPTLAEHEKSRPCNSKDHSVKNPEVQKNSHTPTSDSEATTTSEKTDISCKIEELSLGEKVAMEKALKSSEEDKDKSEIDWFSLTRQVSERDFAKIEVYQFDDESNENLCNIIHQEVRDLFSDIDIDSSKSDCNTVHPEQEETCQERVQSDEISSKCSSSERTQSEKKNNSEGFVKIEENVEIPMVLFVRENKKVRTSRRNRRKSSKKRNKDCSVKITCDSQKDEIKRTASSNSEESPNKSSSRFNIHSFLIAISDSSSSCDSSSDWSDDDGEGDVDLLSCPEFSCPMSWNVICAMSNSNSKNTESSTNSDIDAINSAWRINITVNSSPRKSKQTDKKVHFADEDVLTVVHMAEDWSRKGPWEEYARDRERFRRRIADAEAIISPILQSNHRQNILSKFHCNNTV